MTETDAPVTAAARRKFDEELAEARLAKVRERIRKNFPDERSPLTWRRDSATRLVSSCNRFAIEKTGDGEAARYTAKLLPASVIGNRRYTLEQAKADCEAQASPLPLEAPKPVPLIEAVEREPGSDDV